MVEARKNVNKYSLLLLLQYVDSRLTFIWKELGYLLVCSFVAHLFFETKDIEETYIPGTIL